MSVEPRLTWTRLPLRVQQTAKKNAHLHDRRDRIAQPVSKQLVLGMPVSTNPS